MGLFNKIFNISKTDLKLKPKNEFTVSHGFPVVGSQHYQENFKVALPRNPKYDLPKSKLKDGIYEYDRITTNDVVLMDEPTNEYDPNALMVTYKGLCLGYIKKGSASRVKNLLKQEHKLELKFYGGNYKGFIEDEYINEKDDLKCRLTIYTKEVE